MNLSAPYSYLIACAHSLGVTTENGEKRARQLLGIQNDQQIINVNEFAFVIKRCHPSLYTSVESAMCNENQKHLTQRPFSAKMRFERHQVDNDDILLQQQEFAHLESVVTQMDYSLKHQEQQILELLCKEQKLINNYQELWHKFNLMRTSNIKFSETQPLHENHKVERAVQKAVRSQDKLNKLESENAKLRSHLNLHLLLFQHLLVLCSDVSHDVSTDVVKFKNMVRQKIKHVALRTFDPSIMEAQLHDIFSL